MPICQDEVMSVISNMKSGTSPGIDGMPVEILKCFNLPTCNVLAALFNKIIDSGDLPQDWYTALIVPIFKSGSRSLTIYYDHCKKDRNIIIMKKTMYCLNVSLALKVIVDQLILCLFCHLY